MKVKWMKVLGSSVAALLVCGATLAWATALTANRDTPRREGAMVSLTQASNVIYAGAMVAVWTNGLAYPAADTAGYKVVGRARFMSDNTSENYRATRAVEVERSGVFRYVSATNALTDANIGDRVYVVDDQTVGRTNEVSANIPAGPIVDTDADGIWVEFSDK